MLELDRLNFHPLRNIATSTIRTEDFRRFIAATGHDPVVLDLDRTHAA
jgi:Ala-tRNA(Pro) deacylase